MLERKGGTSSAGAAGDGCADSDVARAVVAMSFADLAVLVAGILIDLHPYLLLIAHIALVVAAAHRMAPAGVTGHVPFHLCARLSWPFCVCLLLVAGPLGGLGAVVLVSTMRRMPLDREMLSRWHASLTVDREAEDTQILHEALISGREFKPRTNIDTRRFAEVLEHGALAEKQALLGHIGLKYHADYFPLLGKALRSPEAGVRAQAAAVFVKLKEGIRLRLHDARTAASRAQSDGDGRAMLGAARTILTCSESGFLDPCEARQAQSEAEAICAPAVVLGGDAVEADVLLCRIAAASGGGEALIDRLMQRLPQLAARLRQELARCLVSAGRHVELSRLLNVSAPASPSIMVPTLPPIPQPPPWERGR